LPGGHAPESSEMDGEPSRLGAANKPPPLLQVGNDQIATDIC
jgi:hypothetical protein